VWFGEVVENVNDTEIDPGAAGLEHLEPGSLHIREWGNVAVENKHPHYFRFSLFPKIVSFAIFTSKIMAKQNPSIIPGRIAAPMICVKLMTGVRGDSANPGNSGADSLLFESAASEPSKSE